MRGLLSVQWVLLAIVFCECESTESGNFVDLLRTRRQAHPDQSVIPEGYHAFPEDKVAYKFFMVWETWDKAREKCQLDGGDLAIADTREKIEHIRSIYIGFEDKFYVGIYKPVALQEWETVSNVKLSSSSVPWLQDSSEWLQNDRVCAVLKLSETGLEGGECILIKSFVCEIPIDTNPTGARVDPSETTIPDLRSSTFPDGYTIFPNHNVAYKIYKEILTWDAARSKCKSDGGDLAIADTLDKIQYIQNMDLIKEEWIFVGIWKPARSAEWKTVNEVVLSTSSIPWASWTMPDTILQSRYCATIALSEIGLGTFDCTYGASFVCEIPDLVKTTTTTATTTTTTERVIKTTKTQATPAITLAHPEPEPTTTTTTETSKNFTLRSVEFPQLGILYTIYADRLTHHEARKGCFSNGGRLAVVDSFEKINYISKILDEESVHVGIRVSSVNFEEWVGDSDGVPLKDLPWTADNPHPAKCVALKKDGSGLEETLCSNRLQYLCEVWRIMSEERSGSVN